VRRSHRRYAPPSLPPSRLPPSRQVFVSFRFFLRKEPCATARCGAVTTTPRFEQTIALRQLITGDFLDYLSNGALELEVWGAPESKLSPAAALRAVPPAGEPLLFAGVVPAPISSGGGPGAALALVPGAEGEGDAAAGGTPDVAAGGAGGGAAAASGSVGGAKSAAAAARTGEAAEKEIEDLSGKLSKTKEQLEDARRMLLVQSNKAKARELGLHSDLASSDELSREREHELKIAQKEKSEQATLNSELKVRLEKALAADATQAGKRDNAKSGACAIS